MFGQTLKQAQLDIVDDHKCELELMDSTISSVNASSSVSADNIETDMFLIKAKSLRSAIWKEFSRTINKLGTKTIEALVCYKIGCEIRLKRTSKEKPQAPRHTTRFFVACHHVLWA
ncbi:hypothetical protein EJ110_NYTH47564 [Nymphaea thermarum]|nr:hypothetical protein EJ110_NYTH47564 [Nymphaea thermarum]